MLLLWKYHGQYGSNSTATMIAANCSRAAQLLRLDVDVEDTPGAASQDSPEAVTYKESRRRLFWACWQVDVLVGAGVERFLTLSRSVPSVNLPCAEQDFIYRISSRTSKLIPKTDQNDGTSSAELFPPTLEAYHIRIQYLRSLILRCIRDARPSPLPWEADAAFGGLVKQLQQVTRDLPAHLQFSEQNAYIHHDQGRLGLFISLHAMFHVCFVDLFRVTFPIYNFPISSALSGAPAEFISYHQRECLFHAQRISEVNELGLRHGPDSFVDSISCASAYESARVQMVAVRLLGVGLLDHGGDLRHNVDIDMQVLYQRVTKPDRRRGCFVPLIEEMRSTAGFEDLAAKWASRTAAEATKGYRPAPHPDDSGAAWRGCTSEHVSPLAYIRQAWEEIRDGREPLTPPPQQHLRQQEHLQRQTGATAGVSDTEGMGRLSALAAVANESYSAMTDSDNTPSSNFCYDTLTETPLLDPFMFANGGDGDFNDGGGVIVDPLAPWTFDVSFGV